MIHHPWQRTRLKYVVEVNAAVLPESTDEEFEFAYIDIGNVSQGSMNLEGRPLLKFGDAPTRARRLANVGDSVVSTVRTYLRAVATVPPSDERLVFSTGFAVLHPLPDVDPRFLSWYLQGDEFVSRIEANSTGVSYPAITATELISLDLRIPPRTEQRAIADYLDRETARIDTLIEEQHRLIEVLRERRIAVVDSAFASKVSDTRLQRACVDVVDCPHTTPEVWEGGQFEAVRTASVRAGSYRPGKGLPVSEETWRSRNAGGAPAIGDVLFTREAPAGEACLVPREDICLGQRMVLLRIDGARAIGQFVLWQLYSRRVQDYFRLSANGSTVTNVRLPVLRSTPIWLPPLDEQRRIAAYLDEQASKIDELIAETERFIELSRERRAALITAAVTGQIDVRGVA